MRLVLSMGTRVALAVVAAAAYGATGDRASSVTLIPVGPSELREAIRASAGPVIMVNVWATWCVPCREEFPALLQLRKRYGGEGLDLILVSADFPSQRKQAEQFLADQGVAFCSYLKVGGDEEFIDSLSPEWSGALPATFVFDGTKRLVTFWQGKASYERFEREALGALGGTGRGDNR